jgi:aspartate racemase
VVGVLGGMGPAATTDFLSRLVRVTPALEETDHLRILVDLNPRIPSRTRAILPGEPSPAPYLADGARGLVARGAQVLAVPCNSAAYFLDAARSAVAVEILDPIEATARHILAMSSPPRRLVVLAGMVSYRGELYNRALPGLDVRTPTEEGQRAVQATIDDIKRGDVEQALTRLRALIASQVMRGGDAVVLGCTEFSLIADRLESNVPLFDSNELLARWTVEVARLG